MSEKREKPHWEGKHYSFFQNTECEYFPCHRIADPARFNCLFCYCPLYMLGPRCGGNFRYTGKGIKDCTNCVIPHLPENYGRITGRYKEIAEAMRQPDGQTAAVPPSADAASPSKKGQDGKAFGRIVMMACTERGFETMGRAAGALKELLPGAEIVQTGRSAYVPGFEEGPRLSEATAEWFHASDALIFFAAAGIAVRCIAPFARDKFQDPAVLVLDENGKFVISLMSGHAGGANRLCQMLAEALGAQPVITTATDGRGLFAVDVFATENGLQISDRSLARQISARILAGERLKIFFEEENTRFTKALEKYGEGICIVSGRGDADIIVSCRQEPGDRERVLYLIPRAVTLGVGCRKGIAAEAIRKAVLQTLQTSGVSRQALYGIASIDLKKEEAGLHAFAKEWQLPLTFYTADELMEMPGIFSKSDFVRSVTGVDCVCERSAMRLAQESAGRPGRPRLAEGKEDTGGQERDALQGNDFSAIRSGKRAVLLVKKQSMDGVTVALALNCSTPALDRTGVNR